MKIQRMMQVSCRILFDSSRLLKLVMILISMEDVWSVDEKFQFPSGCTVCRGSFYESSPCSLKHDRQCIHVAHPILVTGSTTNAQFLQRLKVEAHPNKTVYLEDMHNMRNLETTVYVTDTTQASDFYWDRESGLRVNIGILNVHLIPEYHDVDHDSDNKYMLSNPNESEDKNAYQKVVEKRCRHPIPDHYSVTLEVARDRTTATRHILCDSKDPSKIKCPQMYKDGDVYIQRTLNDACPLMNSSPEFMEPAANSIVCAEDSLLLSNVFNQTSNPEKLVRFPPEKCKSAERRCEHCFKETRCQVSELLASRCCQADCLSTIDCKLAFSKECTSTGTECASGDVYRYTIQPVFQTLKRQFRCHIKHQKLLVLYELFYFLQIPATNFQTSRIHRTIHARSLDYQRRGEYHTDYLTVEHRTGLDLEDDLILVGQKSGKDLYNYSIQKAFAPDKMLPFDVHEIRDNIYVATTQFEKPFDYSTSTWVQNNDCHKNVSKMRPVLEQNQSDELQGVNVVIQNAPDSPFQYFLKSVDNPPYIRFTVPGHLSILPYYFKNNGPVLLTDDSLSVTLELSSVSRIWIIQIQAKMSDCPAYLGIKINDRVELEELIRYDLLILCPAEFNVTFRIPNWGQLLHKTFEIILQDSRKSTIIYLSYFSLEYHPMILWDKSDDEDAPVIASGRLLSWASPVAAVAVVMYATLITFIVCVYFEKLRTANSTIPDPVLSYQHNPSSSKIQFSCKQMYLTGGYILVRVIYSLAFSFTAFSFILVFSTKPDLTALAKFSEFHKEINVLVSNQSDEIQLAGNKEIYRQNKLAHERMAACSNYIGDLMTSIAQLTRNITASSLDIRTVNANTSFSHLVLTQSYKFFTRYHNKLDKYLSNYTFRLNTSLEPILGQYMVLLEQLYQADWLAYVQRLFNTSDYRQLKDKSQTSNSSSNISGDIVDFVGFLGIVEAENIRAWSKLFLDKLQISRPVISPALNISISDLQTQWHSDWFAQNSTRLTDFSQLNSTRFFASSEELIYETKPPAEKPKLISSPNLMTSQMSEEIECVKIVAVQLLWIACILDLILLLYRARRTYIYARLLYLGLEEPLPKDRMVYWKVKPPNASPAKEPVVVNNHVDGTTKIDGDIAAKADPSYECQYPSGENPDSKPDSPRCCHSAGKVVRLAIKSNVVPQLTFSMMLMLLLYLLLIFFSAYFDSNVNETFTSFLAPVLLQVNETNSYVIGQAKRFTDEISQLYLNQMWSEIENLVSLVQYFNSEQKRIEENKMSEACSLLKFMSPDEACDVKVSLSAIDVPLLHCNFLPIESQIYTEFKASLHEHQMSEAFRKFLDRFINVLLTVEHVFCITVAIVLTVHVTRYSLFQYLRIRRHCLNYVDAPTVHLNSTSTGNSVSSRSHNLTFADCDSDGCDKRLEQRYPTAGNSNTIVSSAMLLDFGYSETKV